MQESNLSTAEITIEKAKVADRIAISQAIKTLNDSSAYMAASNKNKLKMEEDKKEEVMNRR